MTAWSKKRILVPIDFSDESFVALDEARHILAEGGELIVIHALQELHPAEFGERYHTVTNETREQHIREAFAEKLSDPRFQSVKVEVVFDDAAHGIAEYAEQNGIDLIVMPSHGWTGIKRLLIGSVAERVIRLAHCPVLILRS